MNASAIRETVALAERISPPDLNAHSQKVDQAQARINHIESLLVGLLGVEAEARWTLESHLREAQNYYRLLKKESEQLEKLQKIGSVYQRLSLEPLTWRDTQGFPKLVVFTLASPFFCLEARPNNNFAKPEYDLSVVPNLPQNIKTQYKDVLQLLATQCPARKGLRLTCRFEGLIPREARQRIKEARGLFGNEIFIVAEPGSFTLNEINPLPKGDPLIVGYDPSADPDGLWLIADFDTTPVEEAMIFHFDNSRG